MDRFLVWLLDILSTAPLNRFDWAGSLYQRAGAYSCSRQDTQ